jgi:inorganic pyrophosphatase
MNLSSIPTFVENDVFHVVVEVPRGSTLKLKYESRWRVIAVSRPLPLGVSYPFDWGFVPATRAADGDPLDAMLLWDVASYPGVVIQCRAIGVMQVEQNKTNHDRSKRIRNDRIMAVPLAARREGEIADVAALPDRVRQELEQFAVAATALKGKDLRVIGWADPSVALGLVHASASSHRQRATTQGRKRGTHR